MDRAQFGILAMAAAFSAAFLGACDRPSGRAVASPSETHARNSGAAPRQANELPRDAAAAARSPSPATSSQLLSGDAISDTLITGKIKAAILTDPGMAGADVSVNTDHGVVVLAGGVKSYEQAGVASAHAQRQDGVMRVDNQLTLVAP